VIDDIRGMIIFVALQAVCAGESGEYILRLPMHVYVNFK